MVLGELIMSSVSGENESAHAGAAANTGASGIGIGAATAKKEEEESAQTQNIVEGNGPIISSNDMTVTADEVAVIVVSTINEDETQNVMSDEEHKNDNDDDNDDDPDHQCQLWSNNNDNSSDNDNHNNNQMQQQQYNYGDIWSNVDAFGLFATQYDNDPDSNSNNNNSLHALLDTNNFSLVDLLAHEELLQELRGCNEPRLMEYLGRPDVVAGLVECLLLGWNDDDVFIGGKGSECGLGRRNDADYEKEKKARWCAVEAKRGEEEEKLRTERKEKKKTSATADTGAASTTSSSSLDIPKATANSNNNNNNTILYDISSPRQSEEELRVEAKWNSPPDSSDNCFTATEKTHVNINHTMRATYTTHISPGGGGKWPLHYPNVDTDVLVDGDDDDECEKSRAAERTPEEEYDMQFIRYPYMACEVLCSDAMVGFGSNSTNSMLNVLVDGYVNEVVGEEEQEKKEHDLIGNDNEDIIINDEEDSLLDVYNNPHLLGGGALKEDGGELYDDSGSDDHDSKTNHHSGKDDKILDKSNCVSCNFDMDGDGIHGTAASSLWSPIAPTINDNPCHHQQQRLHCQHNHHNKQQSKPRQIRILDLLFGVLMDSPPSSLDDRRAGYFEKVLNVLFQKRSHAMSDYMNTKLIVTDASVGMARLILDCLNKSASNVLGDSGKYEAYISGYSNAMMERSSSYISLSRQRSEDIIDGDKDNTSNKNSDDGSIAQSTGANDKRIECKFPMPDAPPMLMCALFDHLHSYPIMHVVQRLLMPSPLRRQHVVCRTVDSSTSMDSTKFSSPSATPSKLRGDCEDEDDECDLDDQIEDPINQIFQCDWMNRNTDQALELLLRRLAGDTSSFLVGYGYPVGYDVTGCRNDGMPQQNQMKSMPDTDMLQQQEDWRKKKNEAALLCSQHASEILTTIIQNSSLDAPVMKSLSSDPCLRRIIDLIVLPPLLTSILGKNDFVAHESVMTCAITVLESLVLQLGGYGVVVGTPGSADNRKGENIMTNDFGHSASPSEVRSAASSKSISDFCLSPERAPKSTLLRHVTALLTRLSELLNDPITDTWVGPSQYSGGQQRLLLGASRLRIVRLIESFGLLGDPDVDLALQSSGCLEKCIELFWKFEWCSMLHQSAANLLVHVFEGGSYRSSLQEYFLGRCKLLERLMGSFEFEDIIPSTMEKSNERENATRYDEMMLAMKSMFVAKISSSMESEHGSQSVDRAFQDDDGGAIAPVSEDDVDSAMEKECEDQNVDFSTSNSITPLPQGIVPSHIRFRKGYMGHVIIICQALVHACSNVASEQSDKDTHVTNDDKTSTTLPHQQSTAAVDSNILIQAKSSSEPDSDRLGKVSSIDELLRKHPLFDKWQRFVTLILVPEISVQSTPLGGQPALTSMNQMMPPVSHGNSENSFFEINENGSSHLDTNGSVGEFIAGEIDMDENDFDTAAAMIEALRVGDKRRHESGDGTAMSIANFGSTIYQPGGFKDYVYDYDDPLGHLHPFDSNDYNDEGDEHGFHEDGEGFMSDAMVISKDGVFANQGMKKNTNSPINKSGSDSSDEEDDDEDNNVPVLDLFTGSFQPDFANFDAFEGAVANGDNSFDYNGNDNNRSREVFLDAINGCIHHPTTDTLFEFSETPFDLVDSLSTEAENEENIVR